MNNANKLDIILRKAELNNLKEIQSLFKETILYTCQKDYTVNQRNTWASSINNIDKWKLAIQNEYFIIALQNEKIIGFGSLKNGNYLNLLYVHPNYLKVGIASNIYEELKKESLRLKYKKLEADVSITALPFFEKKGFKVLKKNYNIIDGLEIINYKMSE